MNDGSNGSNGSKAATGRKNVIDEGTTFKGSLTSNSTVVVLGVMEGEITGPAVEVQESGVIVGKARITELRSRGELAGDFEADQVELSGRVRDQTVIRARTLVVSPRGDGEADAMFGECQIEVGEVPSKEKTIEEVLAATRRKTAPPELAAQAGRPDPTPSAPVIPLSAATRPAEPAAASPDSGSTTGVDAASPPGEPAAPPETEAAPSLGGKRAKRPPATATDGN